MDWKKESEMFNQMAAYYDIYRPGYPQEIIDAIVKKANLIAGSKLLEIGSGSGKATAQFADYGFDMLCIDPGEDLIKKARERFKGKNIEFIVSRFEDYSPPPEAFDAIISAQAFHWVPKPDGLEKCAAALKKGGYLMPFWNIDILRDTAFDQEFLPLLDKYDAYTSIISEGDYKKRVASKFSELTERGFFTPPEVIQAHWVQNYTAEEYFGYAQTGNVFVQKDEETKKAFFEELGQLAAKYNGMERHYVCELYVTRKVF